MIDALRHLLARPIAHRGLHGGPGAGGRAPIENSLGAAAAAIAHRYGIECDVQFSRDGEALVFHDDDLVRLTGRPGVLADHNAATLATMVLLGGDERIPTLAQLLDLVGDRVPLVVEIKPRGDGDTRLADRVLDLVSAHHGSIAIESFDPRIVVHCRARNATCPIGLVGPPDGGHEVDAAAIAASDVLSWNIAHLDEVASAHATTPLTTWTIRDSLDEAKARRLGAQIVFEGFAPADFHAVL